LLFYPLSESPKHIILRQRNKDTRNPQRPTDMLYSMPKKMSKTFSKKNQKQKFSPF